MSISFGNKRVGGTYGPGIRIFVGRGSIFGNRIVLKDHEDDVERAAVLVQTRQDIATRIREEPVYLHCLEQLKAQAGRDAGVCLVCYCHPKPCHAHIMAEILEHPEGLEAWVARELSAALPVTAG